MNERAGYDKAISAGMTPAEADAWLRVADAAGACLQLTENEPQHPMEREEVCHAFHSIQGWLASRPTLRTINGPVAEQS